MTATTTTTTTTTPTTTAGARRGRAAFGQVRRLARAAGSRWHDFVAAGQLGPSGETATSRHTGARI
jgi:hypothetical protein